MDAIIRKYNYRLETGTVGTDNDNIATVLYNINRMEKEDSFISFDMKGLDEDLDELFFMVAEANVHFHRFLDTFSKKIDKTEAEVVVAAFKDALGIVRSVRDVTDTAKKSEAFPKVYKRLLAIVPSILDIDARVVGRL
ncbi:MAG: hypothetical protein LBV43_06730 [Prevotella sp.]|jgi:hypothetical protein|nr:hypothetical protein [Prevotella sp.]